VSDSIWTTLVIFGLEWTKIDSTSYIGFNSVSTISDYKTIDVLGSSEGFDPINLDLSNFIFSNWFRVYLGGWPSIARDCLGDSARIKIYHKIKQYSQSNPNVSKK